MKTLALPFIGRFDRNTSSFGPKNWGLAIFDELLWGLRQSVAEVTWIEVQCLWFFLVHLWFPVLVCNLKDSEMAPQKPTMLRPVGDLSETCRRPLACRGPQTLTGSVSFPVSFSCCFFTMVSAPDQQAHRVHAQVRLPRFVLVRCPISGAIWLVVEPYPSEKYESQSVGKDDIPYISHGQYSQKMVDGHPIHNKDPKIMVIINPYEPLDD